MDRRDSPAPQAFKVEEVIRLAKKKAAKKKGTKKKAAKKKK